MLFDTILKGALSLSPVLLFLGGLVYLDTYKLVPMRNILWTILIGVGAAAAAVGLNMFALDVLRWDQMYYVRFGAPIVEEICKAAWPLFLIRSKRVGFMVDAGVYGFATGAGFAVIENIYYMESIEASSPLVWVVRGFGTAVMHGGTTAIFAMISKNRTDIAGSESFRFFLPGLGLAAIVHSAFNQFFLPPMLNTVAIVFFLPPIMFYVFQQSEKATRTWLGVGFDSDADTLKMITSGDVAATPLGEYLTSLSSRFKPEVVVDLLCYLRIYLELAVQAKGILMMRDAGFDVPPAPDTEATFKELEYLEKSIGRTGKLALHPFLRLKSRDLWQLHMLRTAQSP
jgi:RsiW-degrading membrane proteinase PrsW (M82 family)